MGLFVIIPAAGFSRRMNASSKTAHSKLLLDLGGQTVLSRLITAVNHPQITACVIVVRRGDEPLIEHLQQLQKQQVPQEQSKPTCPLILVCPQNDPPDMRSSVEQGLQQIRQQFSPQPDDGWCLIPADHPLLDAEQFAQFIAHWNQKKPLILVPTYRNKRGHPTFFRWPLADDIARLPSDCGLNELLKKNADAVCEISCQTSAILTDLDTPADYEQLKDQFPQQ